MRGVERWTLQDPELRGKAEACTAQEKEKALGQSEGKGTCCQAGLCHLEDNVFQWALQLLLMKPLKEFFTPLPIFKDDI